MAEHEAPLPRRVYFGAADKQHLAGKPISGGGDLHTLETSRRQKLAATLIQRAEDVAAAVKTLRAMDSTGNTEHAIDHLQATLQDLTKSHAIFVDDVTEAIGRYRDRRENQAVIAEAAARRAPLEAIGQQAREDIAAAAAVGQDWVTVQISEDQAAAVAAGNIGGMSIAAVLAEKTPKPGPRT